MNWEAIGALGEIIGAGAVVVSLIYLAVQIRGQSSEARTAGMHAVSQGIMAESDPAANKPRIIVTNSLCLSICMFQEWASCQPTTAGQLSQMIRIQEIPLRGILRDRCRFTSCRQVDRKSGDAIGAMLATRTGESACN
jgi:hypothetical protein